MVKLNKIYTKTGDGGRTRLATGEDVDKFDPRVEAYGAVDEANAHIGLAVQALTAGQALYAGLTRIQNDLFDVGADLATPGPDDALGFEPLRVVPAQTAWLEREIDRFNADLSELASFVLPSGSEAAARLHVARTVTRRAERRAAALLAQAPEATNPEAVIYLNRLSDFLFVAARWVNKDGPGDVLWTPAGNR